tara:strand:- start:20 stop:490 length:471 start_codon:yes stop_codon:yes gene_type:complete
MATVIRGDDNWDTALKAGSMAFAARYDSSVWTTLADNTIVSFNDASTGDSFDDGSNYSTSTYKYTAPTTGVYMFWMSIYTSYNDVSNGFTFLKNAAQISFTNSSGNQLVYTADAGDKALNGTIVIPLSTGDTMAVQTTTPSDVHTGLSKWGGCRLS